MLKWTLSLLLILTAQASFADGIEECKETDFVNVPRVVDVKLLKEKVFALSTTENQKLFKPSPEFVKNIESTFDQNQTKTTVEQFYMLLWILSNELTQQQIKNVSFTQATVRDVLVASKIFEDHLLADQIQSIRFDLSKQPRCFVEYAKDGVEILLNKGKGFFLFRNGKCQHAQKLIFDKSFSFELKKNQGNLLVADFKGVDLFGDFGNRGIVDIDLNYVSLKSVEFYHGTNKGVVVAYVSENEFKHNQHNGVLRMLMRLIPDRSTQPIDW